MSDLPSVLEFDNDISDAQPPKPLPARDYIATIIGAELRNGKTDPSKQHIAVTFKIDPDQYPIDFADGNPDGTTIVYRMLSYNPKNPSAVFRIKQFCQAIGAPTSRAIDLNDWTGRQGKVTVTHDQDQQSGELRAQINKVGLVA